MTHKERIGLFGGTFDPIHLGHLNLAISLLESCQLDQIVFVPAALSPFKSKIPPLASKEHRKNMINLAVEPISTFSLWDNDLFKEGLSYTVDSIKDFLGIAEAQNKQCDLFLILGEDALNHFHLWKNVNEIVRLAPPLIGTRAHNLSSTLHLLPPAVAAEVGKGLKAIPVMDISSSVIRERLKQKKFCGHYLPAIVLDYIQTNQLYLQA